MLSFILQSFCDVFFQKPIHAKIIKTWVMPIERAVMVHRMNLVMCFVTTFSPGGGVDLWELQEQASCFRAVSLINWNNHDEIFVLNI